MSFEHKARTWQWRQCGGQLCAETHLVLSGLRSIKHRAKLFLVLKEYGQRARSVLYKDAWTSEQDSFLGLRVCSCETDLKKRGQRRDSECLMLSSCWELKELQESLPGKREKVIAEAIPSRDQPHEKVQTKEAEEKEQRSRDLTGQSHTLHLLPWLGLQLLLSRCLLLVSLTSLGWRWYVLNEELAWAVLG